MFVRNEIERYKVGTRLVPFCKNCSSQNIETIQTCLDCGSHDITTDWIDKRSQKDEYKEREIRIYKCDKCGKEFNGFKVPNNISCVNGEFILGNYDESDTVVTVEKDLCEDCIGAIVAKLNADVAEVTSRSHIENVIQEMD